MSIVAFDQMHAHALAKLRKSQCFILVALTPSMDGTDVVAALPLDADDAVMFLARAQAVIDRALYGYTIQPPEDEGEEE